MNFGGTAGKEVVIFFYQILQGSYWELFEWIGLLRIGPEAIWKNGIFSFLPPTDGIQQILVDDKSRNGVSL